ncbi:TPA: NAD(P)-dependent oxidoreductase, partial [Candidatus Poribacteria bacterium]|nr:NAD(P)-dependent oxidoreductase [Candidatus Poribacteria bacterium]
MSEDSEYVRPKKVLITGTMGNLGTKIRYHLEEQGNYNLVLMSRNPRGDAAIMQADLSVYNDEWARHFAGVDAIVHMAADPSPGAAWQSLVKLNMDLLLNTFEAAVAYGAKRFIFASSNHTMGGYKDQDEVLKPDTPPHPGNP